MNIDNQVAYGAIPQRVDAKGAVVSKRNSRLMLAALALASFGDVASAQVLPPDAMPTCTVDTATFAGWFASGAVAANGSVKPADSLNFSPDSSIPADFNCSFHKWSEQMFLWLTSPRDGGERVFQSQDFYAVSAPEADGTRTLSRNTPGKSDLFLRSSKPPEQGQPVRHLVLMAGNNSLVYYISQVNEVFAYFLTGTKNGGINPKPTQFPFEQSHLDKIADFAASRGISLRDPNALVVEVKSAWVETTGLDASKYITMTATIPTYTPDPSNRRWTPTGWKQAQLALVGMHVVGSVKARPEMVWATFEHIDNTPMASYSYIDTSNQTKSVSPDPAGKWLFSAHNCVLPFNDERMQSGNAPYIDALPGKTIAPSDICREKAWGSDSQLVDKNTQVIAINNNIMGMLPDGDVRKNYLLVGTIWNFGVGSSQLSNTTLETFDQDKNCFSCHRGNLEDGNLSHMYRVLKPLP